MLQLTFTFYATCPENSCGRDLDPPRGQCLFGGCSCNLPWTGDDCAVELLAPVAETPAHVEVAEGSTYEHQLVLTQVSAALAFFKITALFQTSENCYRLILRNYNRPWTRTQFFPLCVAALYMYMTRGNDFDVIRLHHCAYHFCVAFQGSPQVLWDLLSHPSGMIIDELSGLVQWTGAHGLDTVYTIRARAANIISSYDVTWTIEILLSYSVVVTGIVPNGIIPSPRSITITGNVEFVQGASPTVVPVHVKVTSLATNHVKTISVLSNRQQLNSFEATYHPRPNDVGNFSVVCRHTRTFFHGIFL